MVPSDILVLGAVISVVGDMRFINNGLLLFLCAIENIPSVLATYSGVNQKVL